MRAADLAGKRVGVWGLGREGRAAIGLIHRRHPEMPLVLLDDKAEPAAAEAVGGPIECAFGPAAIRSAIERLDVIVKSPGVSLYRPEIAEARRRGVLVTSLLNLWFAEPAAARRICVTGTKGKSTTTALTAHLLRGLGHTVALAGNIGVAIADLDTAAADFVLVEMSSYQAADFDGLCDVAVLTSLFPEHLDWHHSLENYFRDKLRLLDHARQAIADEAAASTAVRHFGETFSDRPLMLFNDAGAIHARGNRIYDGALPIGGIENPYLARPHNRSNLCAALSVVKCFGGDLVRALAAAADFHGLPHRQQELGEVDGALVVDDSISTTPESALAALAVYEGRDITLIVGGYDRGIDYGKLAARLAAGAASAIICLGDSGARIRAEIAAAAAPQVRERLHRAASMAEAVAIAKRVTPRGGVVLLSPAAPSYGQYRDFIERGHDFAQKMGVAAPA